jgi:putative thiamine transport system substrate-binding protein
MPGQGSTQINAYIAWAGEQLKARHGITLEHVKLTDTAEAVRRIRDEVAAARRKAAPTSSGSTARTSAP